MKALFWLLLLANVAYFAWSRFAEQPEAPGVAVFDESELGPPLTAATGIDAQAAASVGAILGSGVASNLAAVVGQSCASIGPFYASLEAEAAAAQYIDQGMRVALRPTRGEIFLGHWVQIRNIADRATGNDMLNRLRSGGLTEAYLVPTEDEGLKISLGLFEELDRAEKVELQAESLDIAAEITARTREGEVFYVDIGLPPGTGAGAMIETYGEERVLLRQAATCPRPN